jgi:hypothetical protein
MRVWPFFPKLGPWPEAPLPFLVAEVQQFRLFRGVIIAATNLAFLSFPTVVMVTDQAAVVAFAAYPLMTRRLLGIQRATVRAFAANPAVLLPTDLAAERAFAAVPVMIRIALVSPFAADRAFATNPAVLLSSVLAAA